MKSDKREPVMYQYLFSKDICTKAAKQNLSTFFKSYCTALMAVFTLALFTNHASAFDELNEPQKLIYDTSHFNKTSAGNKITYNYIHIDSKTETTIEDNVLLTVKAEQDNNHRDVSVEFLTEERKIHLPDFNNRRGNPVIIGMLEHLAQTMGQETGGGALYFRNRIRDKLADDSVEVIVKDDSYSFSFSPLANDPYIGDRIALSESVVNIEFSEEIPGQLKLVELIYGPKNNSEGTRKLEYVDTKNPQ